MATNSVSSIGNTSIRGFGGLSSGLDRDELIKGMTLATRTKIAKQQQKKDALGWKQDALRAITEKMVNFASKYTDSVTASTNLMSDSLWGRSSITATGANSKYVSVSGSATTNDAMSVLGVKQLAKNAGWTSGGAVSNQAISGTAIDVSQSTTVENLVGKTIDLKYGDQTFSVKLEAEKADGTKYDYATADGIAAAINDQLAKQEVNVGDGTMKKLSDVMMVSANGNDLTFGRGGSAGVNTLKLTGGSALSTLGIEAPGKDGTIIEAGGLTSTVDTAALTTTQTFADSLAGKTIRFSYNGKTAEITLPKADELTGDAATAIKDSLKSQLDKAFGKDRISVELNGGALEMKTTVPGGGADTSSTLSIVSGDASALSALGLKAGESNRVNLSAKLVDSGLNLNGLDFTTPKQITVNGKNISITADDTMNSVMGKIKDAGVNVTYQAAADKFSFSATENGASGQVQLGGDADVLNALFGNGASGVDVRGQDAIIAVKYGESGEAIELRRDSNTFTDNGMNISVSGEFGYTTDASNNKVLDTTAEEVELTAKVDSEKITNNVKDMIKEYNEIISLVNSEVSTKHNRDYEPLTAEQKEEMSEKEIELWEKEAKQGLLFGDSDLRSLASDLRFVIGGANTETLRQIGITTSSSYADNGKLEIDEAKFKAALEKDPDAVKKAFAQESGFDAEGKKIEAGLAYKMKDVMDKYAKTVGATKGILVSKAGYKSSPLSMTTNYIYNQIQSIDKVLSTLKSKLESEQDRYISQFTQLENLISQMNVQSSYISGLSGY